MSQKKFTRRRKNTKHILASLLYPLLVGGSITESSMAPQSPALRRMPYARAPKGRDTRHLLASLLEALAARTPAASPAAGPVRDPVGAPEGVRSVRSVGAAGGSGASGDGRPDVVSCPEGAGGLHGGACVGQQTRKAGAFGGPRNLVRVVVGRRAVRRSHGQRRQLRVLRWGLQVQPGPQRARPRVRRAVVRLEGVDAVVRVAALRAVEALLAVGVRVVPRVRHLLAALATPPLFAVLHRLRWHPLEHVLVRGRLVGGAGLWARPVAVLHRLVCGQIMARQVTRNALQAPATPAPSWRPRFGSRSSTPWCAGAPCRLCHLTQSALLLLVLPQTPRLGAFVGTRPLDPT